MTGLWTLDLEDEDVSLYEEEEFYEEDGLFEDELDGGLDADLDCLDECPVCGAQMEEMWCEACGTSFVLESEEILGEPL